MIRGEPKNVLCSIGVFSFGALVDSEEQETVNLLVAWVFFSWVGRYWDLRDENLGEWEWGVDKVGEIVLEKVEDAIVEV